jgi:hypothetical protein
MATRTVELIKVFEHVFVDFGNSWQQGPMDAATIKAKDSIAKIQR